MPSHRPIAQDIRDVLRRMLCLCAVLLCAPAMAQDDPPGRVGRIATLQGDVWVYEAEPGEWATALRNRPVTSGDRLSTAPGGAASVQIGSTTLYLGASSELAVLQLDDEAMRFRLEQGSLALRVRSSEAAAELMVANFEGRFVPLAVGLYRFDRLDERSEAVVWRGEVQFESPDMAVVLHAGQRARFWQDGQPLATRSIWLTPLDDEFAQAVQREDQAEARSVAAPYVPPEMTGVDDLDRHGRWQQHPEYGAVWSPTVVAVGWAPYRFGQWVWLRPWGWTWVDDAPWGFAPFHYGRWFWWGGRWSWAPGPVVRRPVFAPALVVWTGGPPLGVGIGGRPVVGWVPLAPREVYRPPYRTSPGHLQRLNPHAPLLQPPPAGYGNRGVPGAVTVVPAQALRPRQPVAAAVLRDDGSTPQRPWRTEQFNHEPPVRESINRRPAASLGDVPRARPMPESSGAVAPLPGQATGPFFGRPLAPAPRRVAPTVGTETPAVAGTAGAAAPAAVEATRPEAVPRRRPGPPPAAAPITSPQAAAVPPPASQEVPRRPAPRPVEAPTPAQQTAPAATAGPATPPSPRRGATHPFVPAAPTAARPAATAQAAEAADGARSRDGAQRAEQGERGERRRTPDSRLNQRER